jgi:V8-like Glu-specific endopeptidase
LLHQEIRILKKQLTVAAVIWAAILTLAVSSAGAAGERTVRYSPLTASQDYISDSLPAEEKSRLPMLTSSEQLPPTIRKALGLDDRSGISPQAYGSAGYPFTTRRSGAAATNRLSILRKAPWSGIGRLKMRFGDQWYVCSASVIDRGLVVTAAHCVHDFGQENAGWADEVIFQPGHHKGNNPLGNWRAKEWWIPTVYWNGTDTCLDEAPGVVCENDIAILVMRKKQGQFIGERCHVFAYGENNYGYTSFMQEEIAAQLTQMGYPVALDSGRQMIRTDSLGLQDIPSNVIIGSDQTGGSSGGPWMVNFGRSYNSESSSPVDDETRIVGVTSWGYTDSGIKVQGASRFSTNNAFPSVSNIRELHADVCTYWPNHCQ